MHLEVIAAVKKKTKQIPAFKRLFVFIWARQKQLKILKKCTKFRKTSVDDHFGRPTILLYVANYAKEAYEKVTNKSIKDIFLIADLSLSSAVTKTFDKNEL